MDLLKSDVKKLYYHYLVPSIGAAVVTSIYSFVDTIAIGQAVGPAGAAACAVIMPLFGVTAFLGTLCGIGGAVRMGKARGEGKPEKANAYFTSSLLLNMVLTAVFWLLFGLFAEQVFLLFGADAEILPLTMEYANWIIGFCPFFLFSMYLACIIRSDGAPNLVMAAVIIGGVCNVFGDWFFVFPLGMGMSGAAIATVLGTVVQTLILCAHFFSKKCGLRLKKEGRRPVLLGRIAATGLSAGLMDLAAIVLTCLLNNQIMRYGGQEALAVFGIVITISSLLQHLYSGVGQAVQPLISTNFGAGQTARIRQAFRMSVVTAVILGVMFTALGLCFPTQIIRLFMNATPQVLAVAPAIVRIYFLSFLFMGVNILATYYLQSIMETRMSVLLALLRGLVISAVLLCLLPPVLGIDGVWWSMVIPEGIVIVITAFSLRALHRRT